MVANLLEYQRDSAGVRTAMRRGDQHRPRAHQDLARPRRKKVRLEVHDGHREGLIIGPVAVGG